MHYNPAYSLVQIGLVSDPQRRSYYDIHRLCTYDGDDALYSIKNSM